MSTETLNHLVGLAAIVLQALSVILLIAYVFRKRFPFFEEVLQPVREWGMWIAFFAALGATVMSLYYERVIGYPPCDLCWWARIFMYPQVILFGIALWSKDRAVTAYSIALSVIGVGITSYNHLLQVLPAGSLPCPATGAVSCAQRYIFEYGYITMPLLAATIFAFLIVLMLIVWWQEN